MGSYTCSTSACGTFDQNGNVWELNEAVFGAQGQNRGVRGGAWQSAGYNLHAAFRHDYWGDSSEGPDVGFRVVHIPEGWRPSEGQALAWLHRSDDGPPDMHWPAIAFDAARRQIVLFGGHREVGSYYNGTWIWDGLIWTDVSPAPASSPSARDSVTMAYDSARQVCVIFGGSYMGDTWEWDGTSWTEACADCGPPGRSFHSLAYDAARGVVVLFGGYNASGVRGDTWEWDGASWVEHCPCADQPSARQEHDMAYDPVHGVVVLFGGSPDGSTALGDTWEWDGTNWTQLLPAGPLPSPRQGHAMVYDSTRGVVVMVGGRNGASQLNDTWEWDGTAWTQRSLAVAPPARHAFDMVYDSIRDAVVAFAGTPGGGSDYFGDTWELAPDCNGNGLPDCQDILGGTGEDLDENGVLDACEALGQEWIFVGDAGNADDSHDAGYGGVSEAFWIGKHEVTIAQYIAFLNAVAARGDLNGLWAAAMAQTDGGIERTGGGTAQDPHFYGPKGGDTAWLERPVNYVNCLDAMRYANWLHNGKLVGGQDAATTEDGAYDMSQGASVAREPDALVFLPTEDEWYKAAYYDPTLNGGTGGYWDFPTRSNVAPTPEPPPGTDAAAGSANYANVVGAPYYTNVVGSYTFKPSVSYYLTADQCGNVHEWCETEESAGRRVVRGGALHVSVEYVGATYRMSDPVGTEAPRHGFRVARRPE